MAAPIIHRSPSLVINRDGVYFELAGDLLTYERITPDFHRYTNGSVIITLDKTNFDLSSNESIMQDTRIRGLHNRCMIRLKEGEFESIKATLANMLPAGLRAAAQAGGASRRKTSKITKKKTSKVTKKK